MTAEEPLQRAVAEGMAALGQRRAQLLRGDVRRRIQRRLDQRALGLDPGRAAVAAERAGRGSPLLRAIASHRLTLAALTPNRSAAARWLAPSATAFNTRTRRSRDSAFTMTASLLSGGHVESEPAFSGNPQRFNQLGRRSSRRACDRWRSSGQGGQLASSKMLISFSQRNTVCCCC